MASDDGERAVGQRGTGRGADVGEAGGGDEAGERAIVEPEPAVVQAIADPGLVVRAQVEDQDAAPRRHHAVRLGERARGRLGMVQRLREEDHVNAGVGERQPLDLPHFPRHVGDAPARRQGAGARQDLRRAIDGDHVRGPAGRLDGQVALAAADVGHLPRRQEQAERAAPGRPAAARHQLPGVGAVRFEALLAGALDLAQPRLVGADRGVVGGVGEVALEQRPDVGEAGRRPGRVVDEAALAGFLDQAGLAQQAEVPRHAGLRQSEHGGELGHVEALERQDPEHPEAGFVAEQPIQAGRRFHITESTYNDA